MKKAIAQETLATLGGDRRGVGASGRRGLAAGAAPRRQMATDPLAT